MSKSQTKYIVRILNTDLEGKKPIKQSLLKIKGIKYMYSNAVCKASGIDGDKITGDLSDKEIETLNEVLKMPLTHNIPKWMLNRNKDYETGDDLHLFSSDLDYTKMNDIKRLQKIKSFKGIRHQANLPLRGQKTKSNFRRSKSITARKKR